MTAEGIIGKAQDEIVQSIASFALYGFPESHAASFALIAYASAYLKCHYLAAFTAATLNNQPMGFYQPFTIIKDAQRHGLKVQPVDVTRSDWLCTLEGMRGNGDTETGRHGESKVQRPKSNVLSGDEGFGHWTLDVGLSPCPPVSPSPPLLRLGLMCVRGLREEAGRAIVRERIKRSFSSIDDLHHRVPELRKDELRKLAVVGALNFIQADVRQTLVCRDCGKEANNQTGDKLKFVGQNANRRDALWQVERVARAAGPLYETVEESDGGSPLVPMTLPERLNADLRGTGLTIGRHPMAHQRAWLDTMNVVRAVDLKDMRNGMPVRIAGWVIVRQRPGTAKGFMFLSLEDETGIANVIVTPQLFDKNRLALVDYPFLLIEGVLQHQDNVVSVKAGRVEPLHLSMANAGSHDFH